MKSLRSSALPVAFWAATLCGACAVEIPTAFPAARYQAMIDKSPFSLGTPPPAAPAPAAPAAPSFAQDFFVVGLAKLGSQDFVSIASRDQTQRFSLLVGEERALEPHSEPIKLIRVERGKTLAETKVFLKKGAEEAPAITFDEAAVNNTGGAAPGQPGVPPPPQPMPPGIQRPGMIKQPVRPGFPPTNMQSRPPVRGVVPNVRPFQPAQSGINRPGAMTTRIRRPMTIPSPR